MGSILHILAYGQRFLYHIRYHSLLQQFKEVRQRFYHKLWHHAAELSGAELIRHGNHLYEIRRGRASTFVSGASVMLDSHLTLKIAGNKPLVTKILKKHGFPVLPVCEFDLNCVAKAVRFQQQLNKPIVIKPAESGAAGKGITTRLTTRTQILRAGIFAAAYSRKLLAEAFVPGDSYRLLYLNGEFLDAVRRDPPRLRGDGRHSLREAVALENKHRLTREPIVSLHPITVDPEFHQTIRWQKLSLRSVLDAGDTVTVKSVVNQNRKEENESVRDQVNPETVQMGAEIARLLNIQLAGVDILTTDISRPLQETGGIINEVNTTPGLHHHYLIKNEDQAVPVANIILDYLLKKHHVYTIAAYS